MRAVDTNVLVRFLTRDDQQQAARARKVMEQGVFIPKTVLLETAWVLRYTYEFDRTAVAEALEKVCGLPEVVVEDIAIVTQALTWYTSGFDFADALHLAASAKADSFYSFDRALAKKAKAASTIPILVP
jgi:predicted nucleic-acid-binding protein